MPKTALPIRDRQRGFHVWAAVVSRLLVLFRSQAWQGFYGVGLFLSVDVGIDLHGQLDVGVSRQHLGGLRRDVGITQVGNERMSQRMEVCEFTVCILVAVHGF